MGCQAGGAALAYFASRRPQLLGAGNEHWDAYLHTMTAAYIADVMSGICEWRVVNGTRLGVLLDESFRDHWNIIDDSADPPRIYLEDVRDVGLLWNTSIAGHFFLTRRIGENATDSIDLLERIHRDEWTHTVTGRLVLTNLAFSKPLDFLLPNVAGSDSQYVIVDDPKVRLTTAAALNANFPPVFSNAGVDLPEGHRYWVTDGGALDNSGRSTFP